MTDKITIAIEDHEIIRPAIAQFGEYIKAEVLGICIELGNAESGELVEINEDVSLKIQVAKV